MSRVNSIYLWLPSEEVECLEDEIIEVHRPLIVQ